ncbi:MAG TPA: HIT family protein [Candidatus Nanoarchaeia archaeon]|nr:HIT family protein [Candidatus Nanoarchaeia archaeon]
MSECLYCELVKKKTNMLFENENVLAMLSPQPAIPGHVLVIPKLHAPILEVVPDYIVGELFKISNKISMALFEAFGAHGTNMLVQSGPASGQKQNHAAVNIIPRAEGDGLDLSWTPKQASEEELAKAENTINEATKSVGSFEREKPKPKEVQTPKEVKGEDPRLRYLRRVP